MNLIELAKKNLAHEAVDKSDFQRRARILQSLWREAHGYECGTHQAKGVARPLGSRLMMPWAQDSLANFLTEGIREVVRCEVLNVDRSKGKLYGRPRIFNDLLSSQPLCFNLFGELQRNLGLASAVLAELSHGRYGEVIAVHFEYSPGRNSLRYTNDRSAFDVYLECRTSSGGRGFVGIEVKYHERLDDPAATPKDGFARYRQVADEMGCFNPAALDAMQKRPLQQLWRDHLLAGSMKKADGFDDAMFVVLFPRENLACQAVVDQYRASLIDQGSFASWYLDDVLAVISENTRDVWPGLVVERYCEFARVDSALAAMPRATDAD